MHNRRALRTGVLRSHSSRASLACLLFPFDPQCRTPPRRSTRSTSSLLRRSLLPGTNEKDKPNYDASVLTLEYIFNPATGVYTNKMRIGVRAKAGLKHVPPLSRFRAFGRIMPANMAQDVKEMAETYGWLVAWGSYSA